MSNATPNIATDTNLSNTGKEGFPKNEPLKSKSKKPSRDIYQEITDKVITAIEAGVMPWSCPWAVDGHQGLPFNYSTNAQYRGINILMLWLEAQTQQFSSSAWLTYRQATALGGQVRKGEKGTTCIYYNTVEKENAKGEIDNIPFIRTFTVFNLSQIDGIEPLCDAAPIDGGFEPISLAENILVQSGADITEHGDRAFYRPSTDNIYLPDRQRFTSSHDFYATAFHELTHWTQAKHRLNRKRISDKEREDYAFEELIAELGAAFLMAGIGIDGENTQHESYIAHWLTALRNDKRYLFKAAAAASKAHQYIVSTCEQNTTLMACTA